MIRIVVQTLQEGNADFNFASKKKIEHVYQYIASMLYAKTEN